MSRKNTPPPPTGGKITTADIEAAERDRIVAASLKLQQAMAGPPPSPPDADTAKVLAALDRLEARPTSEQIASRLAEDRRRYVEAENAEDAEANRAWARRLRASGYRGWTEGDR